jgi:hypothetical protein
MSEREVRELLGPPDRVARQIYFQGWVEQWVYKTPNRFCVELRARRGEEAKVSAVPRKDPR